MGQKFGYREGQLPVTEDLSGRLLRLPFYYDLTDDEQARVVDEVRGFLEARAARSSGGGRA
jgi:dTDP-4-amino-4,6-dideoxygalactose transaminase